MKLGIALPHVGPQASPDAILQVAAEAERLDFTSVWVLERLLRSNRPIPQFGGLRPMAAAYSVAYEAIDTLAFVAARTQRVKLGTSVIDALFHVPVVLAKRLATLDQLSGGRVIAGLGQGANEDEFIAANVPQKRRGRGFEEFLAAMRAAWGPDPVSFSGRFYQIPESEVGPKPVQAGGPPILLGGRSPAVIERAARLADGLNPVAGAWDPLEQTVIAFRAAVTSSGRDSAHFQIVARVNVQPMGPGRPILSGSVTELRGDLSRFQELGIDHVFMDLNFTNTPVDEQLRHMARLREAAA